MVQGYLLQGGLIGPHDEGDWVVYEDYVELERKLRNFANQVLDHPCSEVTEEMAMEILGL